MNIDHDALTLRDYLKIVFRRKAVFMTFFMTVFILTALLSFLIRPVYQAESTVLVEKAEEEPLVSSKLPISVLSDRVSLITTQVELIKSRYVMENVVRKFGLAEKLPIKGQSKFEKAVQYMKKKVKVSPVKNTDFISVKLKMNDRELVAPVVNAIMEYYVELHFKTRAARSTEILKFIDGQITLLKGELTAAENELRDYEAANAIVSVYHQSRTDVIQYSNAVKQYMFDSEEYSDMDPDVSAAKKYIKYLDEEIKTFPQKKMEARRLEYAVSSFRELYLMLLKKREEMRIVEEMELRKIGVRNIKVIDLAVEPIKAIWPLKKLNLLFAVIFGFFGGIGMALWVDYLDNRFYSRTDVRKNLGRYAVGSIEEGVEQFDLGKELVPATAMEYLAIITSIRTFAGPYAKKIIVTSPSKGEGKTGLTVNLARALARCENKKVLIIDMNAENPSIGKLFGLSPGHGMNEFMRGEARADKVVRATQIHNVFAVLFGSESSRATLVELEKFSKAMEELSAGYDYVLIDSSECAVHSAVLGIAPLLDYTLMVVRSGQTRRESARQALDRLSSVKCPAIGVVLNGHSYVVPQFIYSRV